LFWANGTAMAAAPHVGGPKVPVSKYHGCEILPILGEEFANEPDLRQAMATVLGRTSQPIEISYRGYSEKVRMNLIDFPKLPSWAEGREARLVEIPQQQFILSQLAKSLKDTRDLHLVGNSQVEYSKGYYVLMAVPPAGESKAIDSALLSLSHSIVIQEAGSTVLSEGRYALVPADLYFETLYHSTANSFQGWSFRRPYVPEIPFKESTVVTARGTRYHFDSLGGVKVWDRRGNLIHETRLDDGKTEAFGSHAAILRRQGITVKNVSELDAMEIGIDHNQEVIRNHLRGSGHSEMEFGIASAPLERMNGMFGKAEGFERNMMLGNALRASDSLDGYLPEKLKWKELSREAIKAAVLPDGTYPASVVKRFIAVRVTGVLEVRLLNDAIHLQAVHAHFGDLGLKLDAARLVSGGAMEFHYDPKTGEIQSASIALNGMLSLHAKGRVDLTPGEVESLLRRLRYLVPSTVTVTAPCLEAAQ